jgi:hypothetical protein
METARAPEKNDLRHDGRPLLSKQWLAFIDFCRHLGHGEIQVLKIQDGVPVLAEKVIEKMKFGP